MNVKLAYGQQGLVVEVPESADILLPGFRSGLVDEASAIQAALRSPIGSLPLRERVREGDRVVITHSDITRATPNDRLLPVLLSELEEAGIRPQDITLINALGTHRQQTEDELRKMLGPAIFSSEYGKSRFHITQHNAFDDTQLVTLGKTSFGHPVRINRHYMEADVRILTGFIEPHLFAGFSGGPKGVLPALAGYESVLTNHGRENIAHPKATWGITQGNPVWEEMREVALMTDPTFILNVTLNAGKQITGVFAGDMLAAHAAGCNFIRQAVMIPVGDPYDVVVTTNSGYPLDINLYQCVKGMSAACRIVRKGGAILLVGACLDGLPEPSSYVDILVKAGSPQRVMEMIWEPGFSAPDQWEAQIQAMIQLHAEVYVYSDGLTDAQIRKTLFLPCRDIPAAIQDLQTRLGPRLAVLPEGPQTIPFVEDRQAISSSAQR